MFCVKTYHDMCGFSQTAYEGYYQGIKGLHMVVNKNPNPDFRD